MQQYPNSPECEQALLSSILQDASIAKKISTADIFYAPGNRLLYSIINSPAMLGSNCDYPVLLSSCSNEDIQEIGGKEYLCSL
jgi:replicative DNA helicase